MKKLLLVSSMIMMSIFVSNCSGDDDNSADQLQQRFNNFRSGDCGQNVVFDYNEVVQTCDRVDSVLPNSPTITDCESTADSFLDKYPGINCTS